MTTSCLTFARRSFLYFFSFIRESTHLTLVRLSAYNAKKSFLGIRAFLTSCSCINFSFSLILLSPDLAIPAISSNILGLNFKNWKISPSFLNSTLASLECLPLDSITLSVLLY